METANGSPPPGNVCIEEDIELAFRAKVKGYEVPYATDRMNGRGRDADDVEEVAGAGPDASIEIPRGDLRLTHEGIARVEQLLEQM